jgi:molybdopterin converting factor small subunit
MPATISIPSAFRTYAGGRSTVAVDAGTVGAALTSLAVRHPQLRRHLYGEQGDLRGFVNVYVNQANIRDLAGGETHVSDGDTITIVPCIAGG